MTANNSKNGTVRTFKVQGATPEQLSAAAAAPTPLQSGVLAEMLVLPPLEAVATPARAAASNASAAEARPINWPAEVLTAATALSVELPEREPTRKRGEAGQLLAVPSPKACPWYGQLRRLEDARRRDDSTVWVLTLANGWGGALPSMVEGENLPILGLLAAVQAAPPALKQSAAFRQLWAGTGSRTSIMGVIAHQTGLTARLRLSGSSLTSFALTLVPPTAPAAPAQAAPTAPAPAAPAATV